MPAHLHFIQNSAIFASKDSAYIMTEDLELLLNDAGIRPTPNRILVLREIVASDCPLSLSELEVRLETLDKSSIFRTITRLLEHQLIHAVEDGRGIAKYELCIGHDADGEHDDMHAHFYCEKCGRVSCLHDIPAPSVTLPAGYEAHSINFMIKGLCPHCRH